MPRAWRGRSQLETTFFSLSMKTPGSVSGPDASSLVVEHAGAESVYSIDRDRYAQFFKAQGDQPVVLAVQVAAPVLATMALVSLAMGFLGHTVPQVNVLVVGFPVRALVNLTVLAGSLTALRWNLAERLPGVIEHL